MIRRSVAVLNAQQIVDAVAASGLGESEEARYVPDELRPGCMIRDPDAVARNAQRVAELRVLLHRLGGLDILDWLHARRDLKRADR
jgi:hypothetical protein